MGQKTNPNLLRLGTTKSWKTKYVEKKIQSSTDYIERDIEIREYITRFFELKSLTLHDYRINHADGNLNLYLSYYISVNCTANNSNNLERLTDRKQKTMLKQDKTPSNHKSFHKYIKKTNLLVNSPQTGVSKSLHKKDHMSKSVLAELSVNLAAYTNNKAKINLVLNCINKDVSFSTEQSERLNKRYMLFQKFQRLSFFEEGVTICSIVAHKKDSAYLLAHFVGSQVRQAKSHKQLISFLKRVFTVLLKTQSVILEGVKIMIRGRLNGVPRASKKVIIVGDVTSRSISKNITYEQKSVTNSTGSYGIKIWLAEKNKTQKCFYNQKKQSIKKSVKDR